MSAESVFFVNQIRGKMSYYFEDSPPAVQRLAARPPVLLAYPEKEQKIYISEWAKEYRDGNRKKIIVQSQELQAVKIP